ncbi:hypothetical protein ES288_A01G122000v1 [Gossypium darwinii]|uniref:Putative plant transposon protein domain-containing protein n=1 Tax=Gossypium darwinii TaxID=34276 RepID=A0A5D2HKG4_GOSDA|nr:hypothetical protein ES288_A01G122000v1 [Gossypium darwinii]
MYFLRENMGDVINILTDGKGKWKCHLGIDFPISFSHEKLTLKARMWLKFINTRICPASDMSNINTFQETLLYAILNKERICVGTWIYRSMLLCVRKKKVKLLFSHLVTTLCKRSERYLQPIEHLIREP